ncbi:MAG TPA: hypothetical protein VJM31_15140 [Vicinamibacterales bacterium]|nr:hypothetical protein [Vicinamibacterales bacterium]
MSESAYTETHRELVSHVRYGYWFNASCEKAYGRLDLLLNVLQLVGGSIAVVSILKTSETLTALMAGILAFAAAVALLVQPSVKAERHRQAKCAFLDLEGRAWHVATDALEQQLARARQDAPIGIDLLAVPAFNATMRAIGQEDAQKPETIWQRALAAVA